MNSPLPSEGGPSCPDVAPYSAIASLSMGGIVFVRERGSESKDLVRTVDSSPSLSPITSDNFLSEDHTSASDYDIVSFDDGSSMPPIVDFATAGLCQSYRSKTKPNRFVSYLTIFPKVCVIGFVMAAIWSPLTSNFHPAAQNMVFAMANTYHSANQCFDGTLNCLHHKASIAGKENNEWYMFQEMLTGFEVSWSTLALEITSVYNTMYPT